MNTLTSIKIQSLNIQKTKSKLQTKTFVETIDSKLLTKLINSDLLQTVRWTSFAGVQFENEKQQLIKMRKLVKNNALKENQVDLCRISSN